MNSENITAAIVALCLCLVVGSMASCAKGINDRDDQAVTDMVKAGANPIAASCAVGRAGRETCATVGVAPAPLKN